MYLLYDSSNLLNYCYKFLPNILQCVEEYEKNIDKIKFKMFFRIYIDISTFLLDKTNENHKVVMNIFDKLLKSNLVELHQITYPSEFKKTHIRRMIRFLPLLDDSIEYFYSKDIDGILTICDMNVIISIDSNIDRIFYEENNLTNSHLIFIRQDNPTITLTSKYKLSYYPIYTKNGNHWIYPLHKHLAGRETDLICDIPAGLYFTNLKISEEEFNKYFAYSTKFIIDKKIKDTYLDEIFLNYLVYIQERISLEDGTRKLYVLPDIITAEFNNEINSFNLKISRNGNTITFISDQDDEDDSFFTPFNI